MLIIDFLVLNQTHLFLASVLLLIFNFNDNRLYWLLGIDILINGIPLVTIILIGFYLFKNIIFRYLPDCFTYRYLLMIILYFGFGILLDGIYNGLNLYIIEYLLVHLWFNLLIFYICMKKPIKTYN